MTTQLDIQIPKELDALIKSLSDQKGFLQALARTMDVQNNLTVGHIVRTRLVGKGPFPPSEHKLGEVSHTLRRSLRASKAVVSGETVVSSIGSNVRYAGVHEFGALIKRVLLAGSVRLRTDAKGNLVRQTLNQRLARFAKPGHKRFVTVPFSGGKRFEIRIPERAPVRTGIRERWPEVLKALAATALKFKAGT